MLSHTRLQIGAFLLDASLDELHGQGATTKLERRVTGVLVYLAERPGTVVSVQELLTHVWSGVIVTPDSVYRAINVLRNILGDDPRTPQYIASVPRRGYRLVAPVKAVPCEPAAVVPVSPADAAPAVAKVAPEAKDGTHEPVGPPRRWPRGFAAGLLAVAAGLVGLWAWHAHVPMQKPASYSLGDQSIAVLPFLDMSEAHDQGYFVDGLTEEVLDRLSSEPQLQVVARTSSFSFRGSTADLPTIARALHVAHVLEGSVRKSGNQLRVTTQLIRADTGVHLWSATYERELRDVFSVQDEIAAAVVTALRVRLLPQQRAVATPRTTNLVAYNEYLLGRELHNRGTPDGFRRAAEAYRRAIVLDPDYAPAYANLALAGIVVADEDGTTVTQIQPSLEASTRAITLAPDRAEGYAARGYLRFSYLWDWRGAQADFDTALAREPGDSMLWRRYADLLAATARLRDAVAAARKATALDPLSAPSWCNLGLYLAVSGDYDEAEHALQRALDISPDLPFALNGLATVKLLEGRPEEARTRFQQISEEGFRLTGIAMAEHSLGHVADSRRALDAAVARTGQGWTYEIAEAYAWCREDARALKWLARARAAHDAGITAIVIDPLLRGLHSSSGYQALVRQMNLSNPGSASTQQAPLTAVSSDQQFVTQPAAIAGPESWATYSRDQSFGFHRE